MLVAGDQYIALDDVYLFNGTIRGFIKGKIYFVNHLSKLVGENECIIWKDKLSADEFDESFDRYEEESPMLKHLNAIEDDFGANKSYESRMDLLFANGSTYKHRTLRTIFDPLSNEWGNTSINEKVAILDKIVKSGQHLELLLTEYKFRYLSQNRKDIVKCVDAALLKIIQFQLSNK